MKQQEIIDRLRQTMKSASTEPANWDSITADTTIASLGFDSLSILDLIYDVQQEFGVEFEAESLTQVKTVGELATFLLSKGA